MSRICAICKYSKKQEIDKLLVRGEPYRSIAKQFSLSESAVYRHKGHISEKLVKAKDAQEIAKADGLLCQVRDIQVRTLNILTEAEQSKNWKTALLAIRESRGNLELLAKLLGELNESQTVNILEAPEWITLRTKILNALDGHPEAKVSVSKALESPNGSDS